MSVLSASTHCVSVFGCFIITAALICMLHFTTVDVDEGQACFNFFTYCWIVWFTAIHRMKNCNQTAVWCKVQYKWLINSVYLMWCCWSILNNCYSTEVFMVHAELFNSQTCLKWAQRKFSVITCKGCQMCRLKQTMYLTFILKHS